MDTNPNPRAQELRELIKRGEYCVNPTAVAEAIMLQVLDLQVISEPRRRPANPRRRRRITGVRGNTAVVAAQRELSLAGGAH